MPDSNRVQAPALSGCSQEKAEGAFIAFAVGDALGWPQELPGKVIDKPRSSAPSAELRAWKRRSGGRYSPYEEEIQRGEYSDDTQLTLAVARARLFSGNSWWHVLTKTELPLWTLYERGGGSALKHSITRWLKGKPPWIGNRREVQRYFNAGGNGSAMRVLPHAVFYSGVADPTPLICDVIKDGMATHGHPRALLGATAYAYAAWWLLRANRTIKFGELVDVLINAENIWGAFPQKDPSKHQWFDAADQHSAGRYEDLWAQVTAEMQQLLQQIKTELSAGAIADDDKVLRNIGCFGTTKGAGTISTAAAVYLCSRYAPQPLQAVLKAAFAYGGDTDTIAAMTGGLVGSMAGKHWMPADWYSVQDCAYLRTMAQTVAQGISETNGRLPKFRTITQRDRKQIKESIAQGFQDNLRLDGIREAKIVNTRTLKALTKSITAQSWQLRTEDGQTIYITIPIKSKAWPDKPYPTRTEIAAIDTSASWPTQVHDKPRIFDTVYARKQQEPLKLQKTGTLLEDMHAKFSTAGIVTYFDIHQFMKTHASYKIKYMKAILKQEEEQGSIIVEPLKNDGKKRRKGTFSDTVRLRFTNKQSSPQ